MKKRVSDKFWFPWWPDKWLFGSIRIECTLEERAIWVDLLSMASKDDGYIRANEETPYPTEQLAGMFMVPHKTLDDAIEKFINLKDKDGKGKLTRTEFGTLYVTTWEKYQFSESYHRVQKHREKEGKPRCGNGQSLQRNKKELPYYNKLNKNTLNKSKTSYSEKHSELAILLESKIKERLPRHKFTGKQYLKEWANEFRIMVEGKEATVEEIKEIIIWVSKDDFWYRNIKSAAKLRKQLGVLWDQMKSDKKKRRIQTPEEINATQKKALEGK